jgi:hypothetical protein
MRLLSLLTLAVTLALATNAASAGPAQPPTPFKISITSVPDGAFTATGHGLCSSGQASTPFAAVARTFPDGSIDIDVNKTFVCDDGSGSFDMLIFVRLKLVNGQFTNSFRWMITNGTGAYEDLAGFGTGEGVTIDGQAIDLYTGRAGSAAPNDPPAPTRSRRI